MILAGEARAKGASSPEFFGTIDDALACVLDDVFQVTGVTPDAVLSMGRKRSVALARKRVYRGMRAHGYSYPEIGEAMGCDHTSVMYGIKALGRSHH